MKNENKSAETFCESFYPYLISFSIAVGGVIFLHGDARRVPEAFNELVSALISVSSITIGFLATAKTIVLSIDDDLTIKHLKGVKNYYKIRKYIVEAIYVSFALLVLSMLALIMNLKPKAVTPPATPIALTNFELGFFFFWIFSMIGAALTCFRVLSLLSSILKGRDNPPETKPAG